jgi:hypothetical protein
MANTHPGRLKKNQKPISLFFVFFVFHTVLLKMARKNDYTVAEMLQILAAPPAMLHTIKRSRLAVAAEDDEHSTSGDSVSDSCSDKSDSHEVTKDPRGAHPGIHPSDIVLKNHVMSQRLDEFAVKLTCDDKCQLNCKVCL